MDHLYVGAVVVSLGGLKGRAKMPLFSQNNVFYAAILCPRSLFKATANAGTQRQCVNIYAGRAAGALCRH